jgi:hypothetical protein
MIPSDVRDALKTRLQTITGLRAYDIIPPRITPPCAVVGQLDFNFDSAMARGMDEATVEIDVIVQRFSERAGQDKLDAYLAGSGAGSIKAAIEGDRTLGGKVDTLRVISATSGNYTEGDVNYLAYRYKLTLWG